MNASFARIRFLLFTQSYVGYRLVKSLNQYKNNKTPIERLGEILRFNIKDLKCFIFHKSCLQEFKSEIRKRIKNDKEVTVYLQIEKELITLTKDKEQTDYQEIKDYNERAILSTAIERVSGDHLSYIKTDAWFDKRLRKICTEFNRKYYKVVDKYKLPTMRIIPFLIRILNV